MTKRLFNPAAVAEAGQQGGSNEGLDNKGLSVFVTGSSGLVGKRLCVALQDDGHQVKRVVRSTKQDGPRAVVWNPSADEIDPTIFNGADAVVHLAGESIADKRWSTAQKKVILDSRAKSTRNLAEALAALDNPPKTLVCASAIGFYGSRGDEQLTEESETGDGFLAEVCRAWEDACQPARDAGIRVVNIRIGMVVARDGGALAKMLTPFKMGAGGILGSGKQYMSWIEVDDLVRLIEYTITEESLDGPVNAVAPKPITNFEFTKALGRVLGRPTIFPMPAFAARLAFGEMADELLLSSARVFPKRATDAGFVFARPEIESALRYVLKK
ncbi:MAG: TIGR01777 family oxidoreductase [Phycisphaerae bacterium]